MRIFITGSNGFIGSRLVQRLGEDKNIEVTAHTRQDGSLKDEGYLRKVLADQDIIIHAAAILNPWGEPWSIFVENNIIPTRKLIECAPKNLKQFIFISSVHVLGVKHSESDLPLDERSPYCPSTQYSKSKVAAEEIIKQFGGLGLPFTILRPAIVYGPGDRKGMIPKVISLIKENKMILPCFGNNSAHFIYIDDLINGIVASVGNPEAFNNTFILAGPGPIKMIDFLNIIRELTGAKKILTLPYPVSFCAAQIFKLLNSRKREPIIHPDRLDIMCGNRTFSTQKAQKLLHWIPSIGYYDGLRATLASLGENE